MCFLAVAAIRLKHQNTLDISAAGGLLKSCCTSANSRSSQAPIFRYFGTHTRRGVSATVAQDACPQILDYMLDKLMEAESLAAKRLLLKKLLRVTQFTMLLLSVVCVGIMSAACAFNVLASNLFFKSAAEYRAGDSVLGSSMYDNAIDVNDRADNFQGVSPESLSRAALCPHVLTPPPCRYRTSSRP